MEGGQLRDEHGRDQDHEQPQAGQHAQCGPLGWYAVPATALWGGQVASGLAVYGGYGLVRGGAAWALLFALSRGTSGAS